ncbi:MAG: hypothetical protein HDT16_11675, partial [Oscillibacter sp.]|nr:hypothetical protein [Oscillibacter sp.]
MKILKTLSKRGLALFLVLTMCVSLLPTTALAAEWQENHPDAGTYCGVPAHTHTDECYANTLVCVLDEFQEHLHG